MLREIQHMDVPRTVPLDEFGLCESSQELVHVHLGVIREHLGLDATGPVFQKPVAVGDQPEAYKEKPRFKGKITQFFVLEESRLDVTRTHANPPLLN